MTTSPLLEVKRPRDTFYLVTSPFIPELVTQARTESELYPRVSEALKLIAKKYEDRQDKLKLSDLPLSVSAEGRLEGVTSLIDVSHEGDSYLFTSEYLPKLKVEGRNPFDGIRKLSIALEQLVSDNQG